jgi:hypothetical protein
VRDDDLDLVEVAWAFGLLYCMLRSPEQVLGLRLEQDFIEKSTESRTEQGKRSAPPKRAHGEGQKQTPEYRIWAKLKSRCKPDGYYGKRGIGLCERWKSYDAFLADMGRRPSPEHILARQNSEADFSPDNCEWRIKATGLNGMSKPKLSADGSSGSYRDRHVSSR